MRTALFFFLSILIPTLSTGQIQVDLFAGMNGIHQLESGDFVPIWGYGYIGSNGITLPAPLLIFDVDDLVDVNMINLSPEAHTIHLHGLDVDQANDGVPHTSFYVNTGESATYSFHAAHPGNYLYHCHVTTTLHLTMGMYGMIVVKYSDNQLYSNGPTYEREYIYLASDLEIETNQFPAQAYPFHEIRPDYFMLNGFSGMDVENNPSQIIYYEEGEKVLLRLGSMAYSKIKFNFPPELQAEVFMSDGRVLPNSFDVQALEVYPGERFSVVIQPPNDFSGYVEATYYSMINNEELHTNNIKIQEGVPASVSESETESFRLYPNPAQGFFMLETQNQNDQMTLFSYDGRIVWQEVYPAGLHTIDIRELTAGLYFLQNLRTNEVQKLLIGG
jgi:FtsP/CotA-like multicopper oxidase with cupredoxin domain